MEASFSSQPPAAEAGAPGWGSKAWLCCTPEVGTIVRVALPTATPTPPRPEQGDGGHAINQTQEAYVTLQRFDINVSRPRGPGPQASPSSDPELPTPAPSSVGEVQASSALLALTQVASLCTFSFQEPTHPLIPFGLLPLISPSGNESPAWLPALSQRLSPSPLPQATLKAPFWAWGSFSGERNTRIASGRRERLGRLVRVEWSVWAGVGEVEVRMPLPAGDPSVMWHSLPS